VEYTGERIIPRQGQGNLEEHYFYYEKSLEHVGGKVVLDIACGVGWGTELLARKARFVLGGDIDPGAVAYARAEYLTPRSNFAFFHADILDIPFSDETFDVVNSIETFEHVERKDVERLIAECRRVLKDGGAFLFSTPNGSKFPYHPQSPAEYRGFHFWHYTHDELSRLLSPFFARVAIETTMHGSFYVVCTR
jgi:2-polyprenyl-3-methyl-5-hydroxy-6-metoxy-1,4-benzoquinol methylase